MNYMTLKQKILWCPNNMVYYFFKSEVRRMQSDTPRYKATDMSDAWENIRYQLEKCIGCHSGKTRQPSKAKTSSHLVGYRWEEFTRNKNSLSNLKEIQSWEEIEDHERVLLIRMPDPTNAAPYIPFKFRMQGKTEDEKIRELVESAGDYIIYSLSESNHIHSSIPLHPSIMDQVRPPIGYKCHRCGSPDHFIQQCQGRQIGRRPSGIPRSFLVEATEDDCTFVDDEGKKWKRK